MGMEVALNNQKGKDGKGNAANAGQSLCAGKHGRPQVVAEHQPHGQHMELEGGKGQLLIPHRRLRR